MFPSVPRIFEFDLYTYMYCLLFSTPGIHRSKEALVPFRKEWCIETMIQVLGFYGSEPSAAYSLWENPHTTLHYHQSLESKTKLIFGFCLLLPFICPHFLPNFLWASNLWQNVGIFEWRLWTPDPSDPEFGRSQCPFFPTASPQLKWVIRSCLGGSLGRKEPQEIIS